MTLKEYLSRVLARNDSIQARLLELAIKQRITRAERGIFEPELYGSYARVANSRQNTVQEQLSQLGADYFDELNNLYQGGLEGLVPTGARVRLGYSLQDLRNNLQTTPPYISRGATNVEYVTFFGVNVTQPLLKNAGFTATLAGIRIAALQSDAAFQEYRRQMMVILSTAEACYWNLYLAQEQVRFFADSVATAERVLKDTRARLEAGKSAELEVLEAESGLALRRSKLSEAEGKLREAVNRVLALYSEKVVLARALVKATDRPPVNDAELSYFPHWSAAYEHNPEYLAQQKKVMEEHVRVGYARNQRLPQLDLKASYGLNGLGDTPGASWDDIEHAGFPSWSVGVEFRVPLAGGVKTANELAAAKLRQREALVNLRDVEVQMINGLDTALRKIRSALESVLNYQTVINFNQNLLKSALDRFALGKLEIRKVLEIESDLLESRLSQVESLVTYRHAVLEMGMVEGSLLEQHKVELTQKELQTKTAALMASLKNSAGDYESFLNEQRFGHRAPPPSVDTPEQKKARESLRRLLEAWEATNAPPASIKSEFDETLFQPRPGKPEGVNP